MNGRKYGLTIGINDYPGTGSDLTGCVNDSTLWATALVARDFEVIQVVNADATLANLRTAIADTVQAAHYGDLAVITYSGHGSWQPDVNGDEPDRRDEGLCPHDVSTAGLLLDDDLNDLFALRRYGARVVMISDSCHSGSVNRFASPITTEQSRVRYMPPEAHLNRAQLPAARAVAGVPPRGASRTTALLMSGCADNEYSYDGINGRQMGAFSYVALEALGDLPRGATYRDWYAAIRTVLPAPDLPQTPQLNGTRTQLEWPVLEAGEA